MGAQLQTGRLEVITGPMFSGKSTELLRRLRMAQIARKKTAAFKHAADARVSEDEIATHGELRGWAHAVSDPAEILHSWHARGAHVIGIDEVQFFGNDLIDLVEQLIDQGQRVIVAGLNQDSFGAPFGPMPQLLARADEIFLARAVCMVCGGDATRTFRKSRSHAAQMLVGAEDLYEARCRRCWRQGEDEKADAGK